MDKRPDVEKLKLDDRDDPHTPSREDDAKLWKDGRDHLNFAYKKPGAIDVKELESNHKNGMSSIKKYMSKLGWDEETIDDILQTATADFFSKIYADVKEEDR